MQETRTRGEAYRNLRLCVDSYEEGVLVGRVFHPGLENGGCEFHSLAQLLVEVEAVLDEANFPQSFTAKRTFSALPEPRQESVSELKEQEGKLATFVIRLMFRQHASWQGSVTWLEGKGEQTFRSVLELILLLDSALGGCRAA